MKKKYLDFGMIGKGLIITGIFFLVTFLILFFLSKIVYAESNWQIIDDPAWKTIPAILSIGGIFILSGAFLFFIHHQFVKLSEVAEDVLSGKYEVYVPIESEE